MNALDSLLQLADAYLRPRAAADPDLARLLDAAARWLDDLAAPHGDSADAPMEIEPPAAPANALEPVPAPEPDPERVADEAGRATPEELPPPDSRSLSDSEAARLRDHFEAGEYVRPRADDVHTPMPLPAAASESAIERTVPDDVLGDLAACALLKAEAAALAADLAPGGDPTEDQARQRNSLRSRAGQLPGCSLWMLQKTAPAASPDTYRQLAAAFEAAGRAAGALDAFARTGRAPVEGTPFRNAIFLAAEAQSALRVAYHAVYGRTARDTRPDTRIEEPTQLALFTWLRETAAIDEVFIPNYLKVGEPADPSRASELAAEIAELHRASRLPEPRRASAQDPEEALFKATRYHLKRLAGGDYDIPGQAASAASKLSAAVRAGLPPSHVGLRDALLQVYERPEALAALRAAAETSDALRLALRETDRFLDSRLDEEDDGQLSSDEQPLSDEVREVARLLGGRALALFGGVPKPHVVERIREAFGASEVVWEETREHQSTVPFDPIVARPDVALVGLFIRWRSHSFEDLRAMCERHGKPYVRFPAGNHPNRLAHEILGQVRDQLEP